MLSLGPPHFPLDTAPEKYRDLYRTREIQLRKNVPAELHEQAITDLRGYNAHIAAVDECIARLLSALQTAGISDRTIFVFTSDHGDMMRSQGLTTKHVPWDESIRVPFLLRYPQKLGNNARRIRTVLNTPDIMPTLLGLAGLEPPGGIHGTDYSRVCAGARPPRDSAAFLQFPVAYGAARAEGIGEYRGLRTERYTYVRSLHGPWLLYENDADPYQMHNVCGHATRRAVQRGLDRALEARLKQYRDDFLPGPAYVARFGYEHNREIGGRPGHAVSPWGDWESTLS